MKKLSLLLALSAIAGTANAKIVVGDTFSFDLLGYNAAAGNGYFVASPTTATFGLTQTFAGAGINGQDITVSSSEVLGATTTTDTVTVSTPTSFLTTATVNGLTINGLELDLGNSNSGSNPFNLTAPIAQFSTTAAPTTTTAAGTLIYGTANTSFALNPGVTVAADGLSFSAVEGVTTGTNTISQYGFHSLSLSTTYANAVPEPSAFAALGLGVVAVLRRRKKA